MAKSKVDSPVQTPEPILLRLHFVARLEPARFQCGTNTDLNVCPIAHGFMSGRKELVGVAWLVLRQND